MWPIVVPVPIRSQPSAVFASKSGAGFPAFGAGYPEADVNHVDKLYDISKLEEFHR